MCHRVAKLCKPITIFLATAKTPGTKIDLVEEAQEDNLVWLLLIVCLSGLDLTLVAV